MVTAGRTTAAPPSTSTCCRCFRVARNAVGKIRPGGATYDIDGGQQLLA
jgi:hypothetical protein